MIAFSKELDKNRELTRAEFLALAQRYRDATDPAEASRLEDEVMRGFYETSGVSQ